jgi:hypothetical protein
MNKVNRYNPPKIFLLGIRASSFFPISGSTGDYKDFTRNSLNWGGFTSILKLDNS